MTPAQLDRARLRDAFRRLPLPAKLATAAVLAVVVGLGVMFVLRANALRGLPDVGDPFDVEAFSRVDVPDERNAFVDFGIAKGLKRRLGGPAANYDRLDAALHEDWSKVPEPIRAWLESNRPALAAWRKGTEKPDALYHTPDEATVDTLLPITQELRDFARLALLEGARLEAEGDMRGAWGWYRATLRSSRLVARHGFLIERLVGGAIHRVAAERLMRWAAEPRVGAPSLREALDEVVAIDALTPPTSYSVKLEYLVLMRALADPNLDTKLPMLTSGPRPPSSTIDRWAPWLSRVQARSRASSRNEPERSRRVLRLVFANWLAYCDLPKSRRPPTLDEPIALYEPDATAPPAARALPTSEIARWYETTIYARVMLDGANWRRTSQNAVDRERDLQAELTRFLAEQLRRREQNRTAR